MGKDKGSTSNKENKKNRKCQESKNAKCKHKETHKQVEESETPPPPRSTWPAGSHSLANAKGLEEKGREGKGREGIRGKDATEPDRTSWTWKGGVGDRREGRRRKREAREVKGRKKNKSK